MAGLSLGMLTLSPIQVPKAADVLADSLREQILDGRLRVGAILPNERDLAERAAATRTAWRIVAENLAVGAADESAALDLWIASQPHRANLELPGIRHHGLARARAYWALVVAG